jgi:hypothetical protein
MTPLIRPATESVTIHLYVPDADAVFQRALDAGAASLIPVASHGATAMESFKTHTPTGGRSAPHNSDHDSLSGSSTAVLLAESESVADA